MTNPESRKAPSWYAVRTKPGCEYLALTEMQRVGFTVYMPQYRREYRHHRSKMWVTKAFPLFLGYVFTPSKDFKWGALKNCDGVSKDGPLYDVNGKPVPIAGEDIADIKDAEEKGALDRMRDHGLRLRPGEQVQVTEGVFAGTGAVIDEARSVNTVRVLLTMFGGQVVASGPVAKIGKVA